MSANRFCLSFDEKGVIVPKGAIAFFYFSPLAFEIMPLYLPRQIF